jgi:hypothetical protein
VLSYRYATSPAPSRSGCFTAKAAGQQGYERSDGVLTLRIPFQSGCGRLQGAPDGDSPAFPLVRAWLEPPAGIESAIPSSGEDPQPRWQTTWYLPRSTRTSPPPRSSQWPRGNSVLPIFIPQGWPQAMNHLPWIGSQSPRYPRRCRSRNTVRAVVMCPVYARWNLSLGDGSARWSTDANLRCSTPRQNRWCRCGASTDVGESMAASILHETGK